jgi:large subunit ribosomal protein L10
MSLPDALISCRGEDLESKFREQRCREDAQKSLPDLKAKTFILKGGCSLALTKERKEQLQAQYETWIKESQAVVLTEYTGLTMHMIDELRSKVRDAGGEFHVVKNTIGKRAFDSAGFEAPEEFFIGSTAFGIAFEDAPGVAKVIKDFGKDKPMIKVKGGLMDGELVSTDVVMALAELPPLPVVRGQLLGTIMAPASKLVRTIAEPGRSLAQVVKAHADAVPA